MKYLGSIFALLISAQAQASYLEACEFSAIVTETSHVPTLNSTVNDYTKMARVKIDSAVNRGSHRDNACSDRVGTKQWLVSAAESPVQVGQLLVINYFYVNSRGPNGGMMMSETWNVLEGRTGALVYDCFQTDRSLPNYTIDLRAPSSIDASGIQKFNVFISRDSDLILSEDNVHVNYLPDQVGGMERIIDGQEFSVTLKADKNLGHSVRASGVLILEGGDVMKNIECVSVTR